MEAQSKDSTTGISYVTVQRKMLRPQDLGLREEFADTCWRVLAGRILHHQEFRKWGSEKA